MERIAHWWNGSWGSLVRKDVWLDRLDDGRFEIRWSGGDWGESRRVGRVGRCWRREPAAVTEALRSLLGDDLGAWKDLEAISRSLPPRESQPAREGSAAVRGSGTPGPGTAAGPRTGS